ncbi:MerR family transcriptional regulator [Synechococcus sp. UW140]|uniref:MerR family transcriptional regulator n=1 Tax=Synechococcus sp. UW140 TaxID=368503 RepID=UPI000E0E62C8|nr:MerR family transcriptional regulator [Synechococcus sp. UW140]
MDPDPPSYSLDQLLAQASDQLGEPLNPRTVRLYATEGLIDRPGRDGRRAIYGQRQLRQLLLIRSLAARGLSLSAIAPLTAASDDELAHQLSALLPEPTEAMAAPLLDNNQALAYLEELPSSPPVHRSRSHQRRSFSTSTSATSHWQRIDLAPGVELHLSDAVPIPPAGPRREHWLEQLTQSLNDHFNPDTP